MSCDVAKFTITKNFDNRFDFTIKANGSTLPLELTPFDTFKGYLINLETGATALAVDLIQGDNPLSGIVALVITAEQTAGLVSERGSKVDRYYLRPTYKLIIDCVTENNGIFTAKVPEVYVD